MWRGDIKIKEFINIDLQQFIGAQRWQRNCDLDDLWYDMPESRQISNIITSETFLT